MSGEIGQSGEKGISETGGEDPANADQRLSTVNSSTVCFEESSRMMA